MSTITNPVATTQHITSHQFLLPGNLIPNFWYQKFQDKAGGPDLVAIIILGEIVFWARGVPTSSSLQNNNSPKLIDDALVISYEHLENKFKLEKERIRRAFVRLEEQNVLKREVRNIKSDDGTRSNQLFLHLDQEFLQACLWNNISKTDIRYEQKSNIASPHECGDHIKNKDYNYKNRSTRSNLIQNSLSDSNINSSPSLDKFSNKDSNTALSTQTKHLIDFYPIAQEDCFLLQSKSGREFTLNAMNEILKDVARKRPDWSCYSKNGFISYMSEIFRCEKREAVNVSGEGFRINNNLTNEGKEIKKREKFLSEIEYSLEVSPEAHFKKKLASVLEASTAYKLLSSYKGYYIEGGVFKINLTRSVKLSSIEREIILNQAKATHENICGIEVNVLSSGEDVKETGETKPLQGVWGNIRLRLLNYFGSQGQGMDESWFSKLLAEVDEECREVRLKAPTRFMSEWINNHYGSIITRICQAEGYNFQEIEV